MEAFFYDTRLLLLLLPLVVLELGGKVAALVSLAKSAPEEVRGESRLLWGALILLVSTFGWLAWFLAGRKRA